MWRWPARPKGPTVWLPFPALSILLCVGYRFRQDKLAGLELPYSAWCYHRRTRVSFSEKYRHLREPSEAIARQHPEYRNRRTTLGLRETYGHAINHKVVQRLHRMWGLPFVWGIRPPNPSGIRGAITAAGERINLLARKECSMPASWS